MPGNAAIYLADPSMIGSRLFQHIDGIRSYEGLSQGSLASGVRFVLDAGQVTMNFMPEQQVPPHLQGFCGFAQHTIKDKDNLIYALARIRHVRFVCGCVITPDFDEAGTIQDFLFRFTHATNGLLFLANRIFDYDGQQLTT
jgi:hypothetical protein